MDNLLEKIQATSDYIKNQTDDFQALFGIILGTGLGGLVKEIDVQYELNYADIPHFPVSTVESHKGKLIFGVLGNKKVMAMQGRFHYYEGYTMQELTFPVRVMKHLGIERLFISNAAGGVNVNMETGDLMILDDHINLLPDNPLRGKNYAELGPRFPDMSEPYDPDMIDKAVAIAKKNNIRCHTGVYAVVSGPNLETKAEYVYMHRIGADAVGMSTVPEAIVAIHSGLPVFAVSVITDIGFPSEKVKKVTVEEVISIALEAEPRLTLLIKELIALC